MAYPRPAPLQRTWSTAKSCACAWVAAALLLGTAAAGAAAAGPPVVSGLTSGAAAALAANAGLPVSAVRLSGGTRTRAFQAAAYALEVKAAADATADPAAAAAAWTQLVQMYAAPETADEANNEALFWRRLRAYDQSAGRPAAANHAFAQELFYWLLAGRGDWVVYALEQDVNARLLAGDGAGAVADWTLLTRIYAQPANVNQANDEALFWRRLGAYELKNGHTAAATDAFAQEAQYWKLADRAAWGDTDLQLARTLRTVLNVYVTVPAPARPATTAPFDPGDGTYVGFYAQGDPGIGNAVSRIASVYGRKPAILLYYLNWGQDLPPGDVAAARQLGAALEIALQPVGGLGPVLSDTTYLPRLVAECAAAGVPIFLRFAGEMNGAWTPWGENPRPGVASFDAHAAQYVAAFRRAASAMHAGAHNVAMVWAPNDMPQTGTEAYYPGAQYVDWVGVSAYLPYSLLGEPAVNAHKDWLSYFYWIVQHYGGSKPIMLAEGAVTHQDLIGGQDVTPWAEAQLQAFFAGLPRLFPQVRAIVYWSSHDLTSDYALSDDAALARTFAQVTASPWYLDAIGQHSPIAYQPFGGSVTRGRIDLSAYVQYTGPVDSVRYAVDGVPVATASASPYAVTVDLRHTPAGVHTLTVTVLTSSHPGAATKVAAQRSIRFTLA